MLHKRVILVFIDWFSPGYKAGGPISSCLNFARLMKDEYDVFVFTSDTDHGETTPYKNIIPDKWIKAEDEDFMVFYAQKRNLGFRQIRKTVDALKPDFVYLNNIFSLYYVLYPVWMKWTGLLKAKTIITPRGTLYESALAVKPFKKKVFISVFRRLGIYKKLLFQATSIREKVAIENFFPGSNIKVVDDLPDLQQLPLKICEKVPGLLKGIFIARIVDIKNLLFLLNQLTLVKSTVELTVAGPIEDTNYWNLCLAQMDKLPANVKVNYIGSRPSIELRSLLLQQHLYILPTRGENFGHTIFEALLAGRPVLISDQTPWLDLQQKGIGWDLALNNVLSFINAIEEAAGWDQQTFNERSVAAYEFAKHYLLTADFKKQYQTLFSIK